MCSSNEDLPSGLVRQIVEYDGVVHAIMPVMREADKSEEAVAMRESVDEEEKKLSDGEVPKFMLAKGAACQNQDS
jgi:hypothetical protein